MFVYLLVVRGYITWATPTLGHRDAVAVDVQDEELQVLPGIASTVVKAFLGSTRVYNSF